jgi:asparagine synthase (glutamine-hydrolysing)
MKYLHSSHQEIVKNFDPFESWMGQMPDGFDKWGDLSKAQYLESTLFMSGYLLSSQGDRMTMANSVEGRYPFLDHRFIEFAAKLPESLKLHGLNEKYLLKKMIEDRIPRSISKRPKQAYRAPISSSFFDQSENGYVESILDHNTIDDYGIFDSTLVTSLVDKIKKIGTASEVENMIVTGIISTQLFYKFFILGQSPVPMPEPKNLLRIIEEN